MNTADTIDAKMKGDMSLIQKISMYIPVYKGYREKNLRRDEDRAVRSVAVNVLETTKTDLATIHRSSLGNVYIMREIERIRSKADKYCINVKKSVGGYSGLGDSAKILEDDLDRLIRWDAQLVDSAIELKALTDRIANDNENDLKADLRALEKSIDSLSEAYLERDMIMKGFVE
jgi:hypothetical protein